MGDVEVDVEVRFGWKERKVIGRGQGMDLGFGSAGIAGSLIGREARGRRGLGERDFCFNVNFSLLFYFC